jgi:transcriptional regulator with XRE-family HTH domain
VSPLPVRRALRELGADVQAWRKLRGLTQAQLGDRAGLARQTVARSPAQPRLPATLLGGLVLSPAFDLDPDPRPGPRQLHTAIDLNRVEARIEIALSVADKFSLSDRAIGIIAEVSAATEQWRTVAGQLGASPSDLNQMAPAFEHVAAGEARSLVARAA